MAHPADDWPHDTACAMTGAETAAWNALPAASPVSYTVRSLNPL